MDAGINTLNDEKMVDKIISKCANPSDNNRREKKYMQSKFDEMI